MLDGVGAGIDRHLNAFSRCGVHRHFQVLAVGLVNDRRGLRRGDVVFDRDLNKIDSVEDVGSHRLTRLIRAIYRQKLLLHDRLAQASALRL